jgi:hypothetical protein
MADYYDRLERQLAELTARGAHRGRRRPRGLPALPIGTGLVSLAASALVVVVVTALVFAVGADHHGQRSSTAPRGTGGPAVVRNIYPASLPRPPSPLICESPLTAVGRSGTAHGEARFYAYPPTSVQLLLTARGLRKLSPRDVYAVWLLPATQNLVGGYQLQSSAPPLLLGVIEPPVSASGRVVAAPVRDERLRGTYKMLITVQPRSSLRAPGTVVLSGFVSF